MTFEIKTPLAGDDPFGIYLKGDRAAYRGLRNAFNSAQAALRALTETPDALQDRELQAVNATAWEQLRGDCEKTLSETSKDLETMCWWIATMPHGRDPLERTALALRDMADYVVSDIDNLQPILPEAKRRGDTPEAQTAEVAELKLRPFVQLFGESDASGLLYMPLSNTALIGEITYGQFVLAEKHDGPGNLQAAAAEVITSEAGALTSRIEALQAMVAATDVLDPAVRSYAQTHGQPPVSVGYLRRLVVDMLRALEILVEGLGFAWPGAKEDTPATPDNDTDTDSPTGTTGTTSAPTAVQNAGNPPPGAGYNPNASVANRQDALTAIAELATYFRKTEPHSPICLLLDRAVRWGQLDAGELFREILTNGSTGMSQMALMTGLESQGFADSFGKRGAALAGGIEHPVIDNYAAAIPTPDPAAQMLQPAPVTAPAPVTNTAPPPVVADNTPSEPVAESAPPATDRSEPAEDLPIADFEW